MTERQAVTRIDLGKVRRCLVGAGMQKCIEQNSQFITQFFGDIRPHSPSPRIGHARLSERVADIYHGGLTLRDSHNQWRFALGSPAFGIFFHHCAHLSFFKR